MNLKKENVSCNVYRKYFRSLQVSMYHFACSFAFGELKLLEGSKIISFIARDESQHLAMSQTLLINMTVMMTKTC